MGASPFVAAEAGEVHGTTFLVQLASGHHQKEARAAWGQQDCLSESGSTTLDTAEV